MGEVVCLRTPSTERRRTVETVLGTRHGHSYREGAVGWYIRGLLTRDGSKGEGEERSPSSGFRQRHRVRTEGDPRGVSLRYQSPSVLGTPGSDREVTERRVRH